MIPTPHPEYEDLVKRSADAAQTLKALILAGDLPVDLLNAISSLCETQADVVSALHDAITKLQAERDASSKATDVARSDAAFYCKALLRLRQTLMLVQDNIEDEGDRRYFGSTNDADQLVDIAQHIDGMAWDKIMEKSQPPVDLYALIAEQRARALSAESKVTDLETRVGELREALKPFAFAGMTWPHGDKVQVTVNITDIDRARAATSGGTGGE